MVLEVCPWCGKVPTELSLSEGNTYRWALVTPNCCGEVMGEIRRSPYPTALGSDADKAAAERWWNARYTALRSPNSGDEKP